MCGSEKEPVGSRHFKTVHSVRPQERLLDSNWEWGLHRACSDELLTSQLTFCSVKAQRGTHCKDRKIKISLRSDDEVNAVNCSPRGH